LITRSPSESKALSSFYVARARKSELGVVLVELRRSFYLPWAFLAREVV